MKKVITILLILAMLSALAACGRGLAPELPEAATEFVLGNYVNPADPDDGYAAISYKGRVYAYYGTIKRSLRAEDLGPCLGYTVQACLGYTVQEGEKQEDQRICLLAADPEENYLARIPVENFMNQPDFFRALDTAGKAIDTPDYIKSLDYSIWEAAPEHTNSETAGTEAPSTEAPPAEPTTTEPPATEPSTTEAPAPELSDRLDDSCSLEAYAFRLREITPRELVEQGWVETDAILMRSMGEDNPYYQFAPEEKRKDPEATPELSEAGLLDPDGMVQIYLMQAGQEDSSFNPLRLGVVNTGKEAVHYLDCPIRFFSINETGFYEQSEEGLVDFTGPAGIARGMDKAQLTALLGEPAFEDGGDGMDGLFYISQQMEELVLLLGADGSLQAMFYQDLVLYDPADYVFHN